MTVKHHFWGEKEGKWHRFEKNVEYDAFLIKHRKK